LARSEGEKQNQLLRDGLEGKRIVWKQGLKSSQDRSWIPDKIVTGAGRFKNSRSLTESINQRMIPDSVMCNE